MRRSASGDSDNSRLILRWEGPAVAALLGVADGSLDARDRILALSAGEAYYKTCQRRVALAPDCWVLTCKSVEEVADEGSGDSNSGIVLPESRDGAEVLARLDVLNSAPHCLPCWASKVGFLRFMAPPAAVATLEVEPAATFALAEDDACGRVSFLLF